MQPTQLVEWLLCRYTTPDHAEAILGDLLETARTRGRLWFYAAATQVLLRFAWRLPVAWLAAYGTTALLLNLMIAHNADWSDLAPRWNADYPNNAMLDAMGSFITVMALYLSFIAPYCLLRFGWQDRFSRLATTVGITATAAMPLIRLTGFLVGFAVVLSAIVAGCLLRPAWRRAVVALAVTTGASFAGSGLLIVSQFLLRDHHPEWSPQARWVAIQIAFFTTTLLLTALCTLMHGMLRRSRRAFVSAVVALGTVAGATYAWADAKGDETFAAADVRPSAFSLSPETRQTIKGDRYTLRDATMLAMISAAYSTDANRVVGGPLWLEWDRFDITAKMPPNTPLDTVREMLASTLHDRFKLVTHDSTQPAPAFALTLGKGTLKMTPGDPLAPNKCEPVTQDATQGPPPYVEIRCENQTMTLVLQDFHNMAGAYVTSPVVDRTGLKGVWDFDIRWTAKNRLAQEGADGISFFDALEKQLGLHLEPTTAPLPVLVVDSVNELPTPNAPDIARVLPPQPPGEFDVSVIRPAKPDTKPDGDMSGDQVHFTGITLDQLIRDIWDLPDDGPMLQGGPDWIRQDKWEFLAKAAKAPGDPTLNQDDLRVMVQKLLEERFHLVVHTADQPLDAYNLVAVTPKMKQAAAGERTKCFQGPAPGDKDPRKDHPELNKLRTCQGITMAQFVTTLQHDAPGYFKTPVLDKTALTDAYDFTLSYSGVGKLKNAPANPNPNPDAAPDPGGGLSLFDAVEKELGLRLEKVKRPIPVLVIDHVDRPTEN